MTTRDAVGMTYEIMRAHLIETHGYQAEYFDTNYPVGGPINDLGTLRWLHAAWSNEKGHREIDLRAEPETSNETPT